MIAPVSTAAFRCSTANPRSRADRLREGFLPFPDRPMKLFLPMAQVARLFA
jgi:hypothetical protein